MGIGVFIPIDSSLYVTNVVYNANKLVYDSGNTGHVDTSEAALANVPSAGNTVRKAEDGVAEVVGEAETPPTAVIKTITIPKAYKDGTFRISYAVQSGGSSGYTRTVLRKNGVVIGAQDNKSYTETSWETISQDIGSISAEDVITLCGNDDTGAAGNVKEFRVKSTDAVSGVANISW